MSKQKDAACWHLTKAGFHLNDDGTWTGPFTGSEITDADRAAAQFLIDYHGYGQILPIRA